MPFILLGDIIGPASAVKGEKPFIQLPGASMNQRHMQHKVNLVSKHLPDVHLFHQVSCLYV